MISQAYLSGLLTEQILNAETQWSLGGRKWTRMRLPNSRSIRISAPLRIFSGGTTVCADRPEGWPGSRALTSRSARRRHYTAPAFCAYPHDAFDSGTVRLADSRALALAAVPSRMRPAMPCVMQASRNKL